MSARAEGQLAGGVSLFAGGGRFFHRALVGRRALVATAGKLAPQARGAGQQGVCVIGREGQEGASLPAVWNEPGGRNVCIAERVCVLKE